MIRMYKYSSGNEHLILVDGRDVEIPRFRKAQEIHTLCLINGVQHLAILDRSEVADFRLECYDADGRSAGLEASSALCAVAFADLVGVKAFHTQDYSFEYDGRLHSAFIESHLGEAKEVVIDGTLRGTALCEGAMND